MSGHPHRPAAGALVIGVTIVGICCYQPSIAPCSYACSQPDRLCPDGLKCNSAGMCAAADNLACTAAGDGGPADAPACAWKPSNVYRCVLGAETATNDVTLAATFIDTGTTPPTAQPALPVGTALVVSPQADPRSPEVVVLVARNLTITGHVQVRGHRPLVILASHTVTIEPPADPNGVGIFMTAVGPGLESGCVGGGGNGGDAPLANPSSSAGGGGGGGMGLSTGSIAGAPGGAGWGSGSGSGSGGPAGTAGTLASTDALAPLWPGCRGGQGGKSSEQAIGAPGGWGGGAIQISARQAILISGTVSAGGAGGMSSADRGAGGGGGGAGGAIRWKPRRSC